MRRARLAIPLLSLAVLCGAPPFPNPARAAEPSWKTVSDRSGNDAILYDPSSVTRPSRNAARVWIRKTGGQRILAEFQCSYKIVREVQVVTEQPNRPPGINMVPSDWRGVVPESALGELFRKICQ